ncbi:DUF4902 domain-containing protein [Sulfuriferula nivalis]|nr:DUF4902 domain-containing protein [Sulfuriferula nivalis]
MDKVSWDFYVRMTVETLTSLRLKHLMSAIDLDEPDQCQKGTGLTQISGYTEWVSETTPTITLGWDWELNTLQAHPFVCRVGAPRSNIMIVDDLQQDLKYIENSRLLETFIDQLQWQEEVRESVNNKYS